MTHGTSRVRPDPPRSAWRPPPSEGAAGPSRGDGPGPAPGPLHEYWMMLWRRKLVIVIVFLITAVIAVGAALQMPPTYRARAALMVKFGREFMYQPETGDAQQARTFSLEEIVNSEVEILGSRDLAEQVVRELGVDRLYPEMLEREGPVDPDRLVAKAVARLQDNVTVMDVLESSVIRLSFAHRDPEVAAEALNLLMEKFKDKHVQVFSNPRAGFIDSQLADYEQRLHDAEDALAQFKQTHGVYALEQQKTLMLERRVQLETELSATEAQIAELEQRLTFLAPDRSAREEDAPPPAPAQDRQTLVAQRSNLNTALQETELAIASLTQQLKTFRERSAGGEGGDAVAPHPGVEQFRSLDEALIRLLDLRLREEQLLRDYSEQSRQVLAVRREIEMVEDFLRRRGDYVESLMETSIRDELATQIARKASLLTEAEVLDERIRAFDVREVLASLAPLQARRTTLKRELGQVSETIRRLDFNEKQLRRLERAVTTAERNFQTFVDRSEVARITEELDRKKMINVAVIEQATPPLEPGGVSKKLRLVLGVCVAMAAGVGAALFLELISPP